ncbi:MAG: invasion associated locus B family protein [bacterium]
MMNRLTNDHWIGHKVWGLSSGICLLISLTFNSVNAATIQGQRFQDWGGNCEMIEREQVCYLQQILTERNKPLLVSVIGYTQGKRYPTLVVELNGQADLKKGLFLQVDQKTKIRFTGKCQKKVCTAGFTLDAPMLKQLKKGRKAMFTYTPNTGKTRQLPISLMGITSGLQALR